MSELSSIMTGLLRFDRVNLEHIPKIAYMISQFIEYELLSDTLSDAQRERYEEVLEYYNAYKEV